MVTSLEVIQTVGRWETDSYCLVDTSMSQKPPFFPLRQADAFSQVQSRWHRFEEHWKELSSFVADLFQGSGFIPIWIHGQFFINFNYLTIKISLGLFDWLEESEFPRVRFPYYFVDEKSMSNWWVWWYSGISRPTFDNNPCSQGLVEMLESQLLFAARCGRKKLKRSLLVLGSFVLLRLNLQHNEIPWNTASHVSKLSGIWSFAWLCIQHTCLAILNRRRIMNFQGWNYRDWFGAEFGFASVLCVRNHRLKSWPYMAKQVAGWHGISSELWIRAIET